MLRDTDVDPAIRGGELEAFEFEEQERFEQDLEVIPPRDTRRRQRDTRAYPFRYVCHLVWTHNSRTGRGTGTLIGPRTVLTAAHNLIDDVPKPLIVPAHKLQVIPGRNGGNRPFGTTRGRSFVFSDDFVVRDNHGKISFFREATRHDYAIVKLRDPIGRTAGFWSETPRPAGDSRGSSIRGRLPLPPERLSVNLSGYPFDKPLGTQWRSYNRLRKLQDGLLLYENDTERGHSGSPVWIKRSRWTGGRVLVGVHIRRFRVGNRPKFNGAVHLSDAVMQFIADHRE